MRSKYFLLIFILSLLLRIFWLDAESLWLDEGASVKFANLRIDEIIKSTKADAHPPLYYIILHLWIKIFGDSEASVRFPSVIFGVITVIILYKLCVKFWDNEVALLSSFLTGISVFQVFYSQEARMYALLCLLSVLSFFYFLLILKDESISHYIAYSIVTILLLYTHLYSFFIILAQLIFVVFYEKKKLQGFIFTLFVSFLFFTPRFLIVLNQANAILLSGKFWLPKPGFVDLAKTLIQFAGATYPMPRDENGNVILTKFIIEYSSPAILLLIMLALITFSAFSFNKIAEEKRKTYIVFWLWFIIPILTPFLLSQFLTPFYFTRYVIASSVPFYCLVAIGFQSYDNFRVKKYIFSAVLFLLAVNLVWYYSKTNKEEWREAVKFIEERAGKRDLIIANKAVFYYYLTRKDIETVQLQDVSTQSEDQLINELHELSQKYERIWYVSSHETELKEVVLKNLSNLMSFSMRKKLLGVEIFLFEKVK